MVEKIKCRVNQVFCILGALAPLFGLIFLILMMYNNIWTISKTLTRYLQLTASEAKSIEELRDIVLRVENKIESLKENWN